jgi:hypothetical protein
VDQHTAANANDGNDLPDSSLSPRLRLDTVQRVRQELTRVYYQAKNGKRDVGDASKLGHMLALIARMIEGSTLEERLSEVERKLGIRL